MRKKILYVLFILIIIGWPAAEMLGAAERSVVVIPLGSTAVSPTEKEMYVPASLFRPISSFISGTWMEDGSVLKPNVAGHWAAPLLLNTGTTIVSLQLYWKNAIDNIGQSSVILHLLNLDNGNGLQLFTMSSGLTGAGVQSVINESINFEITSNFKPSILVYLGNTNRWLMGVKVVYRE
jgi:hypothetical protein